MENRYLNVISLPEAARLFAVSTRTVRRLIDQGELATLRIGPTLVIPSNSLPEPLRDPGGQEPLLTLHDAAERLGVAPRQVRELTDAGQLRPTLVGRSLRWMPDEVEALRAARVGEPAA